MGEFREVSVISLTEEERPPCVVLHSPDPNPSPDQIGAERWALAEKSTQNIISKVQPTVVSERRRTQVIDYVRQLIRRSNGCEV